MAQEYLLCLISYFTLVEHEVMVMIIECRAYKNQDPIRTQKNLPRKEMKAHY